MVEAVLLHQLVELKPNLTRRGYNVCALSEQLDAKPAKIKPSMHQAPLATAGQLDAPWQTLVSCVARVSRLTYIKDTRSGLWLTREEVSYYPCQARHSAKVLGCAIRAHWGIENRAHYVRNVTLGEDASRIRTKPGMMARIR